MVRGTNKRIIEINDTQNPYFERAVLYLKDSQADSCKKTLESQAQHFLGSIRAPLLHRARPAFLCNHRYLWQGLSLLRSGRRYPDLFAAALMRFTDSGKTFSPNFFLLQCKSFQNML